VINDYIAQMAPMLGIAGASVAWIAQIPETTRGKGFLPDMALALAGSAVIGILASAAIRPFSDGLGMLGMYVLGMVGATATIALQRSVWPGDPRT